MTATMTADHPHHLATWTTTTTIAPVLTRQHTSFTTTALFHHQPTRFNVSTRVFLVCFSFPSIFKLLTSIYYRWPSLPPPHHLPTSPPQPQMATTTTPPTPPTSPPPPPPPPPPHHELIIATLEVLWLQIVQLNWLSTVMKFLLIWGQESLNRFKVQDFEFDLDR